MAIMIFLLIFIYSLQKSPKSHVVEHVNPFSFLSLSPLYSSKRNMRRETKWWQGMCAHILLLIKNILEVAQTLLCGLLHTQQNVCAHKVSSFTKTWEIATFTRSKQKLKKEISFLFSWLKWQYQVADYHSNGRWKIAQPFGNDSFLHL